MSNDLNSISFSKNILEVYKNHQKTIYPGISDQELHKRLMYASVWISTLITKNSKGIAL